jgi:hypothetical protein
VRTTRGKAVRGLRFSHEPFQAQSYPDHDITFIVACAPVGIGDTLARFVGKGLGEKLGRTVIVENRGFDPIEGSPTQAESCFRAEVAKCGEMVKTVSLPIN